MRWLFYLLDWLAIPLYILMAVVIVYQGWQFLQARQQLRASFFQLERDLAGNRQANAITTIIVALQFSILLAGVKLQAVPYLESERDLDELVAQQQAAVGQVVDGDFRTPTLPPANDAGLNLEVGTPLGGVSDTGFVPTPTLTPTPVGTIIANPPTTQGCLDDRANLQVPANGMIVFYPTTVRGTAFTDNFSSAKLEISGPSTNDQYVVVDTIINPIQQMSEFSEFLPSTYEPGRYQFRLTVFDITNTLVASCMVNIYITDPPLTATPTSQAGE
jgi:hypothetical protein